MLLLPTPSAGDELRFDVGATVEYDSNAFRAGGREKDDVVFRILPGAALYRTEGDLRYRLRYLVPFEQGVRFGDEISDFDQVFEGSASWVVDEANEVSASNRFRYDRSLTRRFAGDDDVPGVSNQRQRVLSNRFTTALNHAFSPRTSGSVVLSHSLFETDQARRQDNQTVGATGDINYALNSRNQVGIGMSFTAQLFERSQRLPESQNFFYNVFGSWVFRLDETTSLSLSGGPTLVQTEEQRFPSGLTVPRNPTTRFGGQRTPVFVANCGTINGVQVFDTQCVPAVGVAVPSGTATPTFAAGARPAPSDLRITAFGSARLSKRWSPGVTTSLVYRRQQSNASGLGGSTLLDAATVLAEWEIDQWWDASVRFDFQHRESIGRSTQTFFAVTGEDDGNGNILAVVVDGPGGLVSARIRNAIETNNYGAGARLGRQIGRNAHGVLRFQYNRQQSEKNTFGRASDFDVFLVIFGLNYRFEPITVW